MKKCLILHPEWDEFCSYLNNHMRIENEVDIYSPLKKMMYSKIFFKLKIPHILIKIFFNIFKLLFLLWFSQNG